MEKLLFKLELEASWWGEPKDAPVCVVHVTGGNHHTVQLQDKKPHTFEFEEECDSHSALTVSFVNKSPDDVVLEGDEIVKDKLIHIKSISIDDIDITNIAQIHSEYDAGEFGTHRNCMDLGWNGTWKLEFNTPFYIWLLETM